RGSIQAEGSVSTAVSVAGSGYNSGTISNTSENSAAVSLDSLYGNFLNDTGGVIRGDRAVVLYYDSSLTNRGSIVGTGGHAAVSA
ncbi:hypothetical protein G6O52_25310, partial [Salmonella enterica subsp. enterica serovar Heidelberg]|uniref:hypothetical protein n=1 Tax=Salmonella enterica TaxID=28901 RepID=UPI0016547A58